MKYIYFICTEFDVGIYARYIMQVIIISIIHLRSRFYNKCIAYIIHFKLNSILIRNVKVYHNKTRRQVVDSIPTRGN